MIAQHNNGHRAQNITNINFNFCQIMLAKQGTFVACTVSLDRSSIYIFKHLDQQGNLIKQISYQTNYRPYFAMLNQQQLIIIVKIKMVDYLVLWNIDTNIQLKMIINSSVSMASNTTLICFRNTCIVCICQTKNKEKLIRLSYYDVHQDNISFVYSYDFQYPDKPVIARKIDESSKIVLYSNKYMKKQKVQIYIYDFNKLQRNRIISEQICLNCKQQVKIVDIWMINRNKINLQSQHKTNSTIFLKNYIYNLQTKQLQTLQNQQFSQYHVIQWIENLRNLQKRSFRQPQHQSVGKINIYFVQEVKNSIVGILPLQSNQIQIIFNQSYFASLLIQFGKSSVVKTWYIPEIWQGPTILSVFFMQQLMQKCDEDLLLNISLLLSENKPERIIFNSQNI